MSLIRGCEPERLRTVNGTAQKDEPGRYILYWVRNSLRVSHNPTLQAAVQKANKLSLPLRAVYTLSSIAADHAPQTERHAHFLLQALSDLAMQFEDRDIPFAVVAENVPARALQHFASEASYVFTDADYMHLGREQERAVEKVLNVPMTIVESNIVVPVETASDKMEHAARTIRPKITSRQDRFLTQLDETSLNLQDADKNLDVAKWVSESGCIALDVNNIDVSVAKIPDLDGEVKPVTRFIGGEKMAQETLTRFLKNRLREYGKGRNEPAMELQSDLSPYLRIGCISPVEIALKTKRVQRAASSNATLRESVVTFLEELIVRRELAINMCWFNEEGYATYDGCVPEFAKASLELHKTDKRPYIYTYEELEAGATHDPFWNAAQRELVVTGKMHCYMRMYWAKQVIGWVEDPKVALAHTLRLNNRWGLDAVDPNSYAGVIWCYGRHDQGWKEREIWGKVRYMNDAGLKRKFDMGAYLSKIESLVAKHGLPDHLKEVKAPLSKNQKPKQMKMKDLLKRKSRSGGTASNKRARS